MPGESCGTERWELYEEVIRLFLEEVLVNWYRISLLPAYFCIEI